MTCDTDKAIDQQMDTCRFIVASTLSCRAKLIGVNRCIDLQSEEWRQYADDTDEEAVSILIKLSNKHIPHNMKTDEIGKAMAIMWHETIKWAENHMRNCENLR